MYIAGLQKTTLIDYPGKIAAVVFTPGCNFCCPFCYNINLIKSKTKVKLIPEKEVLDFLKKRQGLLEGVVITGGEPTLQPGLEDFIKKVKNLDYLVKLDTNGSNPEMLKSLINSSTHQLINYVAMDIKGPLDKYHGITGTQEHGNTGIKFNLEKIKESVEMIKNSGIDYEFRTTVVPGLLDKEDFVKIGHWLKGAKRCFLQQFRNRKTLDPKFQKNQPYPPEKIQEFAKTMEQYVKEVGIRGML